MDQVFNTLTKSLSILRTNPYASATTNLFLVLYAGLAAPSLPSNIASLFEHSVFKLLILFLVVVLLGGNNPTTALLVAIGFAVSMNTLSKYRVFTMANELSSLVNVAKGSKRKSDTAYGPNGLKQNRPTEETVWSSQGGTSRVSMRGYDYAHDADKNLLPGGHGDMTANVPMADPASGNLSGYQSGPTMATIGTADSQL
jgi:Tfp pilus assembly protein FimT